MRIPFVSRGRGGGEKAIDPVCKMEVDTKGPPGGSTVYQSTTYYFCAPGCKRHFEQEPERYLAA